ncbi:MAG TPA: UDP-N-acetylmuramoyl-tripeptide--D-alanyl-D-alanine ligase [Tepidisphaeraceae bacterium]|nr:UDP-N-acetylmuramoyl-tripeptide--D-alanyl-D-alanine ligase [Tepidisphaeraceae bacterium]
MKPISIQQIRQVVGAKPLDAIPATAPLVSSVCTDSRRMDPGSLFVALPGEHYDGHNYLRDAAGGGAVAALVQRVPDVQLPNVHMLLVADTRKAMGKLARHVRQQMRSKVIAVAGSNGKTSTKHLIDSALNVSLRGSISPKSFNNDIGVPLTIFPADPLQDYLVLEVGTNHPGEIKNLTAIAQPDIAVITNCGPEHLEFLGDLLGVRRENASIIEGLNPKGLLVINGDDPELVDAVAAYPGKRITFGFSENNDLFASDVQCDQTGVHFKLNGRTPVFVPLLGKHTASNALAAIAVARRLGLREEIILQGLANAHGAEMRLQLQTKNGITILNDAYNANPASMKAALETLQTLQRTGRAVAILGDMRELGESSERFHREVGQFAAAAKLDALYCVGQLSELMANAARQAGMAEKSILHFSDSHSAAKALAGAFAEGDVVLLKASRAMQLERVAAAIGQGRAHGFFPKEATA